MLHRVLHTKVELSKNWPTSLRKRSYFATVQLVLAFMQSIVPKARIYKVDVSMLDKISKSSSQTLMLTDLQHIYKDPE